jgi:hypothetical protein
MGRVGIEPTTLGLEEAPRARPLEHALAVTRVTRLSLVLRVGVSSTHDS